MFSTQLLTQNYLCLDLLVISVLLNNDKVFIEGSRGEGSLLRYKFFPCPSRVQVI